MLQELPPVWKYSPSALGESLLKMGIVDDILMSIHKRSDLLQHTLAQQLENDRLFRLIVKLGFINERQS